MKVSFENQDKVNGLMTIIVEESDYKEKVEKSLKDYRKQANIPGFRKGMAPMGLIKKQYGEYLKLDTINKVVGEELYKYIKDNKINMLGEPLPSAKQEAQDLEKEPPYTFYFDIAVAPELKVELTSKDKLPYYDIKVDDATVDKQVDIFASRTGQYVKAEEYQKNDMLKGDLRELDEKGNTKEGGITLEAAVMMPEFIKVEDQRKLFDNAKLGDVIVFNPRKAYPDNDSEIAALLKIKREEVAQHEGDFSYQITEISRFEKAEVNQALFDQIYGEGEVKSLEEFRTKIAEGIKEQTVTDCDYKFLLDVRSYLEGKVGKLTFPDEILKRVMLLNNKERGEEFVEKNYEASIQQLTWHLIKEQLVEANKVKIEDKDVREAAKETARIQFAQYGMIQVPEEYVDNYVTEMFKKKENVDAFVDRAIDLKLIEALKKVVTLETKEVTLDEFNKIVEGK
ncbi:trigger factor [Hoylesella nanceiensis]|jgi:trigger factor|uniref:trigger factor n=1 Tax=Hoylesella nanceiensis TaxID=425941 RepID=UPI000371C18C|nr:trigger factor [Hoylesella nanceiensis]MBF1427036.1 trigger factor [Hoylesella nanceiensis]MBF1429543.1 trigger factor [Hoylesella nanceiensis]MBF1431972.1 trigger factor [Hoylesella nanceiensis]MBF1437727.1 trigger factor [Hoylesella nanceiensis]MBF1438887.1 trigger factor [Hoylesella nanceiensis]